MVAGAAPDSGQNAVAVVRYNTNGSLDTSFGNGGQMLTLPDAGEYEVGRWWFSPTARS